MKQFAFFLLCLALGGLIGWAGTPLLKTAVASAHLAELGRELGPALHLEAAYFSALVDKSAERAQAHLAQVPAGAHGVPDYDRARVAAALARLAGQPGEARVIAQAALARVPGRSAYSRARLQELAADEASVVQSD